MSDFEDEPTAGVDNDDLWADDEPAPPRQPPRRAAADDDWDDDWDDAPGGAKRDLTVVYAVVAAAIVIVLAVVLTRPKDDTTSTTGTDAAATTTTAVPDKQWQGPVSEAVDKVEARVGAEQGVFIWTDFEGWHVRNTLAAPVTVVVTADTILQKDASGKTTGDPKTEVTVDVAPGGYQTGADLDLGFSGSASFAVNQGATAVPADQIKLGGKGQADQNPVSFTKA